MHDGSGNSSQTRIVAEQVAESTITLFASKHPELFRKPKETDNGTQTTTN